MSSDNRYRNWTFVVYPESVHLHWRTILDDYHIPWAESPLHDKDINADGTEKKPHIHVVLCYDGKKSYESIVEITDAIHAVLPPLEFAKVHNLRSLIRYFAHLDNPDKWQYDFKAIIGHGGLDVEELSHALRERVSSINKDIISWCIENSVTEFGVLIDYALFTNNDEWFEVATKYSTIFLRTYLSSKRHMKKIKESQNSDG